MAKETIGSNLPKGVITQIKNRETLLKSYGNSDKLSDRLEVLHSSTGWVKLYSGVNRVLDSALSKSGTTEKIPPYREFAENVNLVDGPGFNPLNARKLYEKFYLQKDLTLPTSPSPASEYILSSGRTNITSQTPNSGIEWDRGGEKFGAYNTWDSLGLRPVPGITSATISSRNTYGTLQQAEISFTVWTVEELDICELIYFRPGYTALLEWGHTSYIGNEDPPRVSSFQTNSVRRGTGSSFFQSENSKEVERIIEEIRIFTGGNYDALFGFITNFSWKFRPDGGYDCTLRMVSKGIVLESLKINAASFGYSIKEESEQDKQGSIFHRIFNILENANKEKTPNGKELLNTSLELNTGMRQVVSTLTDFPVFNAQGTFLPEDGESTQRLAYIPLRTFLELLNLTVLLKAGGTLNKMENIISFRVKNGSEYLTFAEHYSLNPLVALPPFPPSGPQPLPSFSVKGIHSLMKSYAERNGGRFEILNIMLATPFLKKEIEKVLDSTDTESNTVYDMVNSILTGVREALGNINHFEILYQEERFVQKEDKTFELQPAEYVITDQNAIILEDVKGIPEIQISGVGSSIIDLQVESKISNETASQVAIAAQGSTGNYRENLEALLRWNMGAIDRHFPIKRTVKEPVEEKNSTLYVTLSDLWSRLNTSINSSDTKNKVQTEAQTQARAYAEQYGVKLGSIESKKWKDVFGAGCEDLNNLYKNKLAKQGHTPPSPIPVELSMKMMGIAGFKIGTLFRISGKVLPSSYRHFGFLVTGVEHSVESSQKWVTSIKTQYYPLPQIQGIKTVLEVSTQEGIGKTSVVNEPTNQPNTPNANRLRQWIRDFGEGRIKEPRGNELTLDKFGKTKDITFLFSDIASEVFAELLPVLKANNIYVSITSGARSFGSIESTRHFPGNALDFTISPASDGNIDKVEKVLMRTIVNEKYSSIFLRYLNEYKQDKQYGGPCFHISIGDGKEGSTNLKNAREFVKRNP